MHDSFTAGVPDHWYSGWERDLWAEYKYFPKTPKRLDLASGNHPKLTRLQQHWLNRKYDHGRNVWVIVGFTDGAVILQNKEWMQPFVPSDLMISVDDLARSIESFTGVKP